MLDSLSELIRRARIDHDLDNIPAFPFDWASESSTSSSPSNQSHTSSTVVSTSSSHFTTTSLLNSAPGATTSSPASGGPGTSGASSSSASISSNPAVESSASTIFVSSIPTTISSLSTTFTSFISTTITASTSSPSSMTSATALPDSGSLSVNDQPVCIGDGLDVSAVGLIETVILPSAVGLIIWLIFAILRPRFRQVYGVREWFPPQDLRPQPLSGSFWAFLFPHVPFVPSIPDAGDIADADAAADLPSDGQIAQRVLWICFLIVLGWSFVGLAGALPLYLVNTPCLAQSVPQSSFGGLYSTLQDLSLLRLLQLIGNNDASDSKLRLFRRVEDGEDVPSNIRTRIIILTVLVICLVIFPALYKIMKEFNKLVTYRMIWLEIRCEGMDMGWLSARDAPGFVGWGEKRIKDFITKSGLSRSLDRSGGIGVSGNMVGIGSGYRSRTQSQRNRTRDDADHALRNTEKARPEIDVAGLFSIGDTGELSELLSERDRILENLEIAETQYIASFRLSTPEPSVAELPVPPEDENDIKRHISRPKALAGYSHVRTQRGRRTASSSSGAPTSYVAPSQYYKLRGVRGISGGRFGSMSGHASSPSGPSFGDSVRSRIVGSRFQEFSRDSIALGGRLPIGSRVTIDRGELGPLTDTPIPDTPPVDYGQQYGMDISSGNEADTETAPLTGSGGQGTPRVMSGIEEEYNAHALHDTDLPMHESPSGRSGLDRSGSSSRPGPSETPIDNADSLARSGNPRGVPPQYVKEQRESFPMRARRDEEQQESQVPLHLRLQPQGPFVRPLSGLDHDDLGAVYSNIREWRTRLKQINNEITDAQNDCYNDIADGARIKGWLITGRGVRFLPGIQIIEGRSKDDILWEELQRQGSLEGKATFWMFVVMVAIILAAALIAVSGLAVASAPSVSHYLPMFRSLVNSDDKIGAGLATVLAPAVVATLFFVLAIAAVHRAARHSGVVAISTAQLMTFKATFFILTVVGVMWFIAVGAIVFAMNAIASSTARASSVGDGSIYMSAFFLAIIINVAVIAPGLLLLQPSKLRRVLSNERHAITPRQRFRALYPSPYDPTYATACCILAITLASTFSLIFPLIGPAVVILLFLTIVAHRFLVGYVFGRIDAQTGGVLQIWLLRRFASIVAFQPILLGLIFMTRRIFIEGGILAGTGVVAIVAVEAYASRKARLPGRDTLSNVTLNALDTFEERASTVNQNGEDSEGASYASAPRMRQRGSMTSVLEMMSLTLAVMPSSQQARGAVPLETESLYDLTATERAARTHPDAPPHLPALPFADHAEEMSGILYAPELIAPPPTIWLPNDSAGIARSEAFDLQRYHNLRTTLDVRSPDDIMPRRSSSSRRRAVS